MNIDFQLTEANYDRRSILDRAIKATYQVYTHTNLFGPLLSDLRDAAKRLVTSLLWINCIECWHAVKSQPTEKVYDAIKLSIRLEIVKINEMVDEMCKGKGDDFSKKYRSELTLWGIEVLNTFYENHRVPCDKEGDKQV